MLKGFLILGLAATALSPLALAGQAARGQVPMTPGGPMEDTRLKEARLQAQILEQVAEGRLDNKRSRRLMRDLEAIRRIDAFYRSPRGAGDDGDMTETQRRDILSRLDLLRGGLYAELAQGPQPRRR